MGIRNRLQVIERRLAAESPDQKPEYDSQFEDEEPAGATSASMRDRRRSTWPGSARSVAASTTGGVLGTAAAICSAAAKAVGVRLPPGLTVANPESRDFAHLPRPRPCRPQERRAPDQPAQEGSRDALFAGCVPDTSSWARHAIPRAAACPGASPPRRLLLDPGARLPPGPGALGKRLARRQDRPALPPGRSLPSRRARGLGAGRRLCPGPADPPPGPRLAGPGRSGRGAPSAVGPRRPGGAPNRRTDRHRPACGGPLGGGGPPAGGAA